MEDLPLFLRINHMFPGMWGPGESGAGIPQGGGLVCRRREATRATAAANQ